MTSHQVTVEGELYLSLETYAEMYCIEVVFLRDVYEQGLLGSGVMSDARVCIAVTQMDRIATVVRLHDACGLDVDAIHLILDEPR